ncbi:TonB-dependent receptor [Marinifilum sp. D737]|nr:TonB-dependent receptor [Marinifilum sp. D737]
MNFINSRNRMRNVVQCLLVLVLTFTSSLSYAQGKKISGIVLDDTGLELPGVSVLEKGTTNGTVTSIDGKFQMSVGKNATIVVSFIGFATQEITVGNQTDFKIEMASDVQQLDQVVVVGYGTKSVKDVTGSIVSVRPDELAKAPVANFDQALSGRMAGVQVTSTDGQPGSGMQIVIRGANSVTGDNSPLYVVDGIPMESFDPGMISTRDIESYDVLKDASASAIYGSRGANGVIIITTKGGKSGPSKVSVNSSVGVQWIQNRLDVMNPYDFVVLQQEVANAKGGESIDKFKEHWVDPELYRNKKGTNWQDEIFREAIMKNLNVSMSGGNSKTKHYVSFDFLNQQGTMIETGYEKYNGRLKLDHNLTDKIKVGVNMNYSVMKQTGDKVAGNNRVSILADAITFRPVEPVNDDGLQNGIDLEDPNNMRFNPVKTLKNTDRQTDWNVFRANAYADFTLAKGLNLKLTGGYVSDNRRQELFYGQETLEGYKGANGINATLTDRRYYTLSTSNVLTYKTKIQDHKFTGMLGYEFSSRDSDWFRAKNTHMPLDNLGVDNIGLGEEPIVPESYAEKSTLLSYFSRVDYSFREKYLLTASFRMDGSSKFLGKNKWGYFPSFSFGWRMIEESFVKDLNLFSNLKFRAGWGATGNNRIPTYSAHSQMNADTDNGYNFAGQYSKGIYMTNLADKNLKWETTYQYNAGLDMGFFDNRLNVNVDVYKKNTVDLLLMRSMAPSTSFKSVVANIGEIENKGLEVAITSRNIDTEDFKWTTNFNISFNRNKTVKLNDGESFMLTNPEWNYKYTEYQYITEVGSPVGQIYGLLSDGLYQVDDFNYVNGEGYVLKDNITDNGGAVVPGSVKYKDLNNDNTIDERDRTVIGNPEPKHFGGINNSFKYKNWDFSFLFQWSYGNDILNANRIVFESPSIKENHNFYASVADRYTPTNPTNDIHIIRGEKAVLGYAPEGNKVSDRVVEDGSYLKLKTVSLGYNFSKKLLKKTCFSKARVYASAQNLWTLTNYSGYDPEVSVGKYGALTPGLDYSAYPVSSTVTFGVDLTF